MLCVRFFIAIVALSFSNAYSAEPPPPNFVQMPFMGEIDQSTGLLRSFDSGMQKVGYPPYLTEWYYAFSLDSNEGQVLHGSHVIDGYGGTFEVQGAGHQDLGPIGRPLPSGNYFIHVTTNSPVLFHFGLFAVPPLSQYQNDAGHSQNSALSLGILSNSIFHNNSFYTYFPRSQVTSASTSSATGSLIPDFNNPVPYAPSPDWYQFTLTQTASVQLRTGGVSVRGPTFVLVQPNGVTSIWSKEQTLLLAQGTYFLEVLDQVTQVGAGGNGVVTTRNPHIENFEHYGFQLLLNPDGSPTPSGPSTVDLTATLVDVNTNPGIGVHSTSTVPGGLIAVTYKINNIGSPTSGSGDTGVYLSDTSSITPSSLFLARVDLLDYAPAAGSTPNEVTSITLPSTLSSGTYYIIVVANYNNEVGEANYSNNSSNALPITVTGAKH